MIARIRRYYSRLAERYPERIDYLRARTLISLSAGMLIAATALLLVEVLVRIRGVPVPMVAYWFTGGAALLIGAVLYLGHTGRMLLAQLLSTALVYGLAILSLYTAGAVSYGAALLLLGILMTGMLFGKTGGLLATPFSLILFLAMIYAELNGLAGPAGPVDPQVFSPGASAIGVMIITTGLILRLFSGNLEDALNNAERVAHQLRAVADLAQIANTNLRSESLLPRLVDLIQERLNIDHVQIFLADEQGEYAHLVASTGPAGQQLLARGHKLAVASRSVIGQVMARGERVYAADTSTDPIHRTNEFLAATRSELALPLREGDRVIGALDVQSTRPNAFTDQDIETLQVAAGQIAAAVSNARLFGEIQASLEDNRRLYEEAQANLATVERLNRQLTGRAWEDYLAGSAREFGVTVEGAHLHRRTDWTPALTQAAQAARPVIQDEDQNPVIAVPIDVRGQVLGALEVTLPAGISPQDAQDMIEVVAARLALALDNSRLFDETQTLAQQEHAINELGARLQAVGDVDEMLRVTLAELSRVLGAHHASVRLQAAPLLTPAGHGQEP